MKTRVTKWGNSLAVRIPKSVAQQAGIKQGDDLEIAVPGKGKIGLKNSQPVYSLDDLLKGITKKNRHDVVDWGPPVGREIW
jgi:antitoxin MazE